MTYRRRFFDEIRADERAKVTKLLRIAAESLVILEVERISWPELLAAIDEGRIDPEIARLEADMNLFEFADKKPHNPNVTVGRRTLFERMSEIASTSLKTQTYTEAAREYRAINGIPAYPSEPGFQKTDTSRDAAASISTRAASIQPRVFSAIVESGEYGMTTNEIADLLKIDRGTIQPRTSELRAAGKIVDSKLRRRNANGKSAIVWRSV